MIHPDSRTLPWIQEVAEKYKFKEVQLIEKTIRAFSLLEALVRSNTSDLSSTEIASPLPTKLNRLKKTNIEAFYYWSEVQKLIQ